MFGKKDDTRGAALIVWPVKMSDTTKIETAARRIVPNVDICGYLYVAP